MDSQCSRIYSLSFWVSRESRESDGQKMLKNGSFQTFSPQKSKIFYFEKKSRILELGTKISPNKNIQSLQLNWSQNFESPTRCVGGDIDKNEPTFLSISPPTQCVGGPRLRHRAYF